MENNQITVSIIVPVYNVKEYLEQNGHQVEILELSLMDALSPQK